MKRRLKIMLQIKLNAKPFKPKDMLNVQVLKPKDMPRKKRYPKGIRQNIKPRLRVLRMIIHDKWEKILFTLVFIRISFMLVKPYFICSLMSFDCLRPNIIPAIMPITKIIPKNIRMFLFFFKYFNFVSPI